MAIIHKVKPGNDTVDQAAIAEDIAVLQEAFGRLVGHIKDNAVEGATHHARRVAATADEQTKVISQKIEERPFTAMLVAFGVGLIGGKLLLGSRLTSR